MPSTKIESLACGGYVFEHEVQYIDWVSVGLGRDG